MTKVTNKKTMKHLKLIILIALQCAFTISHCQTTLPRDVADAFGNLYVYHNNRVCPMQTLARDFTIKLTGKPTYKDFTAEQVLTGFIFYYDEWAQEPMLKIKGKEVRQQLAINGKYANMNDFVSNRGYKLTGTQGKNYSAADEKYNLALMNATGSLLRIFPYNALDTKHKTQDTLSNCPPELGGRAKRRGSVNPSSSINWFSPTDNLPIDMPEAQSLFVRKSMNLAANYIAHGQYAETIDLLNKIRLYQDQQLGSAAPSNVRIQTERIYNHFNYNRLFAIILMIFGIITFIIHNITTNRILTILEWIVITFALLYLATSITLRGIIAGHFPVSNGFETMQFLALIAALIPFISLLKSKKQSKTNNSQNPILNSQFSILNSIIPHSSLICGIALMVATMSELNPRITQLMPVLQSPLLSIHVMVIMISYALFALLALNSISNLIKEKFSKNKLTQYSPPVLGGVRETEGGLLLTPNLSLLTLSLFLLTAGIFIGAIWANMSWGRYWGWDPKEVWALITMLIYSLPLHRASLPIFRNPRFLNWYFILAFLSVIITYFGVNFLLGGFHSYA